MSDKSTALDEQIFHSEQFAPLHGVALGAQFKDITLTAKVGEFEVGHKFAFAILVGDASLLILIDEDKTEHAFRLNVSVGEAIDMDELHGSDGHDESCDCGHEH